MSQETQALITLLGELFKGLSIGASIGIFLWRSMRHHSEQLAKGFTEMVGKAIDTTERIDKLELRIDHLDDRHVEVDSSLKHINSRLDEIYKILISKS